MILSVLFLKKKKKKKKKKIHILINALHNALSTEYIRICLNVFKFIFLYNATKNS